jgi:hypothetical protein
MTDTEPPRRWYRPTPGHIVALLFAVEGFLLLSARFEWFAFGRMKGIPAVLCMAAVAGTIILLFAWFLLALCFRLRFQYSLRTLMLLTLATAIACSWLAVCAKRAREQRQIVVEIEKLGGRVTFHYEYLEEALPYPLTRLRDLLGEDYFGYVRVVNCSDTPITDAGLEHLQELSNLQALWLNNSQITDAGLEHLKGLTKLEVLWLDDTRITDAGLGHIKGLTNLKKLRLNNIRITDGGLECLRESTKLKDLDLYNTPITDAGLEHLKVISNLECLYLTKTQVTAEGVMKLQQALPNCKIIH